MLKILLWFHLRYLRRHLGQSLLTLIGIGLGVGVVVAIDLTNEAAFQSFEGAVDTLAGKATHEIVGGPAGVPDATYRAVVEEAGIETATPIVASWVEMVTPQAPPVQILGIDLFTLPAFRAGDPDAPLIRDLPIDRFLTRPDAAVLSEKLAARLGLDMGDRFEILADSRLQSFEVIATYRDELFEDASEDVVLVDVAAAQERLGKIGQLDRIDLILDESQVERVQAVLPPGTRLQRPETRSAIVSQLLSSFRLNLTALSLLAIVVGAFLAFNAAQFSVVRRRTQIGQLRCLGVTRRQVVGTFLLEAALFGLVGGALGTLGGWLLTGVMVGDVGRTVSQLYVFVKIRDVPIDLWHWALGVGLGLLTSVAAAYLPSREAARIEPIEALRRSREELRFARLVPVLLFGGGSAIAIALALLLWPSRAVLPPIVAVFALLVGIGCVTPLLARVVLPLAARLAKRFGWLSVDLGARSILRSLSRTGSAMAALGVALSMTVAVMITVESFRRTLDLWVAQTIRADIYIAPASEQLARNEQALPDELITALEQDDAIEAIDRLVRGTVPFNSSEVMIAGVDTSILTTRSRFRFKEGSPDTAWSEVRNGGALLAESFAYRNGYSLGDVLRLETPHGERELEIAGVFYDYSRDSGYVLVDRATFEAMFGPAKIKSLALYLKDGIDPESVVDRLKASYGAKWALQVRSNRTLRDDVMRIFDQTFAITYLLQAISVGMALIGIAGTITSLLLERAREVATLRAVGLSLRQLGRLIISETGLIGLFAGLVSLGGGAILAWILVAVVNLRSFGWSIDFHFVALDWLRFVALAVAAGLLAGVFPWLRARRLALIRALREE
ncbi:MAG: FtsX-like permease family protein [Planctomycetota bacterium]